MFAVDGEGHGQTMGIPRTCVLTIHYTSPNHPLISTIVLPSSVSCTAESLKQELTEKQTLHVGNSMSNVPKKIRPPSECSQTWYTSSTP